jgi:hypothetical protein
VLSCLQYPDDIQNTPVDLNNVFQVVHYQLMMLLYNGHRLQKSSGQENAGAPGKEK